MTRGIRNNNPLNIRINKNNDWEGKIDQCTMHDALCTMHDARCTMKKDPEFEQFVSMYYGFRAAILTIESYILKHRCNTIRTIISRWAPASDGNNTDQYIKHVCYMTGIGGEEPISSYDPRIKDIVAAMARVESGENIQDYFIALDKAFLDHVPQDNGYIKERKKHYEY